MKNKITNTVTFSKSESESESTTVAVKENENNIYANTSSDVETSIMETNIVVVENSEPPVVENSEPPVVEKKRGGEKNLLNQICY